MKEPLRINPEQTPGFRLRKVKGLIFPPDGLNSKNSYFVKPFLSFEIERFFSKV
jgi:hypothetical protein